MSPSCEEKTLSARPQEFEAASPLYVDTMEKLVDVVRALSAAQSLQTVMEIVRTSVRGLMGSDGATFILRDGEFCFYAEEDAISPLWKGHRFPMECCISGWVMKNRTPALIDDINADPRIPTELYDKTFVKSLVVVPIRTEDPIGAIGSYWAEKRTPSAEEVKILRILADTTAISMDNLRYRDEIANTAKQLETAMDGTLAAIANMVQQKDYYTSGHQRRVGQIAFDMADRLGWTMDRCETLRRSGYMHDIGKIGIPSELLTKPARLTPDEFEVVKVHAENSYQILRDIALLSPIAQIIRQHHERLDGSGYPLGLSGTDILPEARVLAVADVFEAMTSDRPYRPALGVDVALAHLLEGKGTLYEPRVVDILVRIVRGQDEVIDGG